MLPLLGVLRLWYALVHRDFAHAYLSDSTYDSFSILSDLQCNGMEGLLQVVHQVVDVFNSHRDAQQIGGCAAGRPLD